MGWVNVPLIGLDVGHGSIKAVSLSGRHHSSVLFAGLVELAPPETVMVGPRISSGLASLSEEYRLARQPAAVSFTERALFITSLTMPAIPDDELTEALRWEAKKHFSCAIDELVVDYLVIGRDGHADGAMVEVVLVAGERAALMTDVEPLKQAGLNIVAIDANPLAWVASIHNRSPELLEGNVALIDMGAGKVEVNFVRNGALRMTRRVTGGGQDITDALARELDLPAASAEQLKRQIGLENPGQALEQARADRFSEVVKREVNRLILEIQRSIEFYRVEHRQSALQRLLLGGGTALLRGLGGYMAGYFEAPIELDDPFAACSIGKSGFELIRAQAPRFGAAMGLAQWTA
ncbi:MAG TPA: type IV pilus assembly protein PilM [Nitrospiria bacterium]|nr:type IV pilus assembly protein PilM [Nitrospiria bacterium]